MKSPIVTATFQAAFLSTASNIIAQFIEAYRDGRPFALDLLQLLRFVALTFMSAPPNFLWQQFLERQFPAYLSSRSDGKRDDVEMKQLEEGRTTPAAGESASSTDAQAKFSLKNTLTKWFIDCMTVGALMNTLAFFILMGILKGQSGSQIASNIRTETIPLIIAGYKIWPIASIISFSFVPVHRRIVFLSFVGLLWGIYMSIVAAHV